MMSKKFLEAVEANKGKCVTMVIEEENKAEEALEEAEEYFEKL